MSNGLPPAHRRSLLLPALVVGGLAFCAIAAAAAVAGAIIYMERGGFDRPLSDGPGPVGETRPTAPAPEPEAPAPPADAAAPADPQAASSAVEADRRIEPAEDVERGVATAEAGEGASAPRPRRGGTVGNALGGLPEAPPPPPPPMPIRVGGRIPLPTKVRDVRPVYPAIARQARIQGVVIIEATISPQGTIQDAKVLRSIPLLDHAALEAVRQWEYEPTYLNGVPVPVIVTVTVRFTLQ
jgi:protein TonB